MARRILAVLLAAMLAVIGTIAVLLYVRGADARAVADAQPVNVLVAKQRVPAGTTGVSIRTNNMVELVKLPAGSVPLEEVLAKIPAELDSFVITSDLQPRQLLLRPMFSHSTRTSGGLAIPEGQVAVSFEATLAEEVAGFVRPGSQVAIYASYVLIDGKRSFGGAADDRTSIKGTAVLLSKVEVIAIGQSGEGSTTITPIDGENADGTTTRGQANVLITVAVGPVDAARVIEASRANAIYLALINDSSQVQPGMGVDSRTIFG